MYSFVKMTGVTSARSAAGSFGAVTGATTTVNDSRGRGLTEYLAEAPEGDLFAAQERRAPGDKLSRCRARCATWATMGCGPQARPRAMGALGVSGGVALLTRNVVTVTAPPFVPSPALEVARVLAGHVHWGVMGA